MASIPLLQRFTTEELTIRNELLEHKPGPINMNPAINFQFFKPVEGKPLCGLITVEIGNMDDDTPIYIKARVRGFFAALTQNGAPAEINDEFHKQAFRLLFDNVRTLIAAATQLGGMRPILLNNIDASKLNLQKQD